MPTPPDIAIEVFGKTDVGLIREHNEDNFLVADLSKRSRGLLEANRATAIGPQGVIFAVCDGMGGAAAGEVASKLAVDIIYENMLSGGPPPRSRRLLRTRLWRRTPRSTPFRPPGKRRVEPASACCSIRATT